VASVVESHQCLAGMPRKAVSPLVPVKLFRSVTTDIQLMRPVAIESLRQAPAALLEVPVDVAWTLIEIGAIITTPRA
jgi:hypothetical protein